MEKTQHATHASPRKTQRIPSSKIEESLIEEAVNVADDISDGKTGSSIFGVINFANHLFAKYPFVLFLTTISLIGGFAWVVNKEKTRMINEIDQRVVAVDARIDRMLAKSAHNLIKEYSNKAQRNNECRSGITTSCPIIPLHAEYVQDAWRACKNEKYQIIYPGDETNCNQLKREIERDENNYGITFKE